MQSDGNKSHEGLIIFLILGFTGLVMTVAATANKISQDNPEVILQPRTSQEEQTTALLPVIAILLSIGFLVFLLIMFVEDPESDFYTTKDFLLFLLVISFLLINLFTIFPVKSSQQGNWFGLFLKRKALEEQQKVRELKDKLKGESK